MRVYNGKSKDGRGTEFTYRCYVGAPSYVRAENGELVVVRERLYVDDLFGERAATLKELKNIMTSK